MNNALHKNWHRLFDGLLKKVKVTADAAILCDKKVILWGYGWGGRWFHHLLKDYDGRVDVSYIIDERLPKFAESPRIYSPLVLDYLDSKEHIVFSTMKNPDSIENVMEKYGYERGKNWIDVGSLIGDSYISYLQLQDDRFDFTSVLAKDVALYRGDCSQYQPLKEPSVDFVFSTIRELKPNASFFDFGCGKAAAIIMAYAHGLDHCLGGVELNRAIHRQAQINLELLDIPCNLIQGDATTCCIDGYDCFFFYNPFVGEIFCQSIENIKKSYRENPRDIYLVYLRPLCHSDIINHGFVLYKQFRVDMADPIMNIYKIKE